jgi:HK97 family phage prohead protease
MNLAEVLRNMQPEQFRQIMAGLQSKDADAARSGMVHRTFGLTVKADGIDKGQRSVRVVASTEAIDSYDEIVIQDWEKRLDRYLANPVVLWNHNVHGILGMGGMAEEDLPIGFSTEVGVVKGQLEATFNFVTAEANPIAEKVWQGFLQGSIRAVSVGFVPHTVKSEKREDQDIYVLSDNELFEISAVPMGANKEAVRMSAERKAEREWFAQRAAPPINVTNQPQPPSGQEKTMDIEQLKAQLAEAEKQNTELKGEINSAKAARVVVETKLSAAATELDAARKALTDSENKLLEKDAKIVALEADAKKANEAREAAEAETIKLEVKALIGKKITAAEFDDIVELRTEKGPKAFAEKMARRPDLNLTEDVTGAEKSAQTNNTDSKPTGAAVKSALKAAEQAANG